MSNETVQTQKPRRLLWRCTNAKCWDEGKQGHDFVGEGTVGICPKCKVRTDDPKFGKVIVPRVVIHYHAPSGVVDGIGIGHPACQPGRKIHEVRGSGVPAAVNCPACQNTEAYKAAFSEIAIHPDYDVPMEEIASVKGVVGFNEVPVPELKPEQIEEAKEKLGEGAK